MSNLSTQQSAPPDLRSLLKSEKVKEQIALALPKHMDPDRMTRVALTACNKTPNLLKCDTSSVLTALMVCSACGIEPDGRNAHLIPYGNTCQLIIDWKGYVILAKRNGIKNIAGDVVCENDEFEWTRDENGLHFKHKIDLRKPRGEMYAAYVIWNEAGGDFDGEVMQKDQIDSIRKRSRASGSGPWVTDYNEMAKKTVVRRASKKWDITPEIREALEKDDEQFERDVTPEGRTAKPRFLSSATEPGDEPPPPEPEESPPQEPSQPTAEDEEVERQKLIEEVNELRDKSGYTMAEFKRRAAALGIVGAAEMLPKYSITALRAIKERWEELRDA